MPGIVCRTSASVWALSRAMSSAVTTVWFSAILDAGRGELAAGAPGPSARPRTVAGSSANAVPQAPSRHASRTRSRRWRNRCFRTTFSSNAGIAEHVISERDAGKRRTKLPVPEAGVHHYVDGVDPAYPRRTIREEARMTETEVKETEEMEVLDEGRDATGEVCGCCQAGTSSARS
jgi:hypothetical protein